MAVKAAEEEDHICYVCEDAQIGRVTVMVSDSCVCSRLESSLLWSSGISYVACVVQSTKPRVKSIQGFTMEFAEIDTDRGLHTDSRKTPFTN